MTFFVLIVIEKVIAKRFQRSTMVVQLAVNKEAARSNRAVGARK